jgi:thiamine-monophosphate kinase
MSLTEFEIIERFFSRGLRRDDVRVGIGDDAAVATVPPGHELVIATDTIVDSIHFPTGTPAIDVGYRALAVNLSDLAAMGAAPAWASLALTMPSVDEAWLQGFVDGFAGLAEEYRVQLIGGDTTRGPLSVTVTVHGFVEAGTAVLRSGARPDDLIVVSGTLGDAAAGLRVVTGAGEFPAPAAAELRRRFLRPSPRVAYGRQLRTRGHAAIDISDGFAADLGHILDRSGVGAVVHVGQLPLSPALVDAVGHQAAVDFALHGGDDYELCAAVPVEAWQGLQAWAAEHDLRLTVVGRILPTATLQLVAADGTAVNHHSSGYRHF